MSEHYDVVVAGAGPADAQCARDLRQREYDVLVLEAEPEDGFPKQSNKPTAETFSSITNGCWSSTAHHMCRN
jgi:digeranylgeranylglycerophospholipid reductase